MKVEVKARAMVTIRSGVAAVFSGLALAACAPPSEASSQEVSVVSDIRKEAEKSGQPFIKSANKLEEALIRFAEEPTLQHEAAMGRALLPAIVYIPISESSPRTSTGELDLSRLSVRMQTLPNGQLALPVYSGLERFTAAFAREKRQSYAAFSGEDALKMALPDRSVALNWGVSPHLYWGVETSRKFLGTP